MTEAADQERGAGRGGSRARAVATLGLLLVALGVLGAARRAAQAHYAATERYEDVYYLPPPRWLKVLSLGYDEALADLVWIRALVYFGTELRHRGAVRHVFRYGEAIVSLDPDFRRVYRWVAMAATYHTGHVTLDQARRAAAFVRRGAERFPDDGQLAWETGAMLVYELAPWLDEQGRHEEARRAREQGAPFLATAARLGAGPPWIAMANARLFARLGRLELAAAHLAEMLALTDDPDERERIAARLDALRDAARVEALRRAIDQLDRRRQRDYPWLPLDLYLLVGPRALLDPLRSLPQLPAVSLPAAAGRGD